MYPNYVNAPENLPTSVHYAALVFDTITIPGDERSRTHPGHGYPESTETVIKYITFKDKEALSNWVRERESRKSYHSEKYRIIEAKPLVVETKVSVDFK